jgi:23S rRNA G2445 N2-methylase RlmL
MIARNIAPGLLRSFAFQWFTSYDEAQFTSLITQIKAKSYPDKQFALF